MSGSIDLKNMSKAQLQELRKRIDALLSLMPADGASTSSGNNDVVLLDEVWMLEEIVRVLHAHGADIRSTAQLRRSQNIKAFREKVPGLALFFNSVHVRRDVRHKLFSIAVDLLYKDLTAMGIAVSGFTLMAHSHRLPSVLDKYFPGYAQAGLLAWVVGGGQRA